MLRALVACLAVVASSCANVPSDYKLDPAKPVGLVVGSITYESSIGEYGLVAQSIETSKRIVFKVGHGEWTPFTRMHDDDLGMRGGTFAVEVPSGEYRIVGWQVRQGFSTSRSTHPVEVPFLVQSGQSTYLGNLHFSPHWVASLHDQATRDLPILERRFRALRSSPLAIAISEGTHLEQFGGGYMSRTDIPIFIPVTVR